MGLKFQLMEMVEKRKSIRGAWSRAELAHSSPALNLCHYLPRSTVGTLNFREKLMSKI